MIFNHATSPHLLRCSSFVEVHYVITSDRRERGDLIVPRQKHEIAKPVQSKATNLLRSSPLQQS
jgi:hypothetical protein